MIIALVGQKGSGKSTAAKYFRESRNFVITSFAAPIKAMLAELLRMQGVPASRIIRMLDGDLKEEPTDFLAGRSPRYAMQTLGADWRDLMHRNLWVDAWARRVTELENAVVDDCRHQWEVDRVRHLSGVCILVNRPQVENDDPHPSEAGVKNLYNVKYTVENDKGFVDLYEQLRLIYDIEVYRKRPGDPDPA